MERSTNFTRSPAVQNQKKKKRTNPAPPRKTDARQMQDRCETDARQVLTGQHEGRRERTNHDIAEGHVGPQDGHGSGEGCNEVPHIALRFLPNPASGGGCGQRFRSLAGGAPTKTREPGKSRAKHTRRVLHQTEECTSQLERTTVWLLSLPTCTDQIEHRWDNVRRVLRRRQRWSGF